jgi:FkbM family methyltransferase|uniref:Methyltransferase FkbM domain-containing protein n=1 Tax=viral metagenome TaxID=1070528 RepID=A0A6C0CWC6_9ZZZZ
MTDFSCKTTIGYLDENLLGRNNVRNKKITYIQNDLYIGAVIKSGGYWEEWMFKYIKSNYIKNTNMIDLGGNIGTTTLLMSEVLSNNCKIFTFEPLYSDILLKNILDNNLTDKVALYPYGVGNEIKTIKTKPVNLSNTYNYGGVHLSSILEDTDDSSKINIVPLDYFNFENVSLIKIDVEGMEIQVLEGCLNLIRRCKPTIIIETHQLNTLRETYIFKELLLLGYDLYAIPEGHNDFIMKIKTLPLANLPFFNKRVIRRIRLIRRMRAIQRMRAIKQMREIQRMRAIKQMREIQRMRAIQRMQEIQQNEKRLFKLNF